MGIFLTNATKQALQPPPEPPPQPSYPQLGTGYGDDEDYAQNATSWRPQLQAVQPQPYSAEPSYDPYSASQGVDLSQGSYDGGETGFFGDIRNAGRAGYATGQSLGVIGPEWTDEELAGFHGGDTAALIDRAKQDSTNFVLNSLGGGLSLPREVGGLARTSGRALGNIDQALSPADLRGAAPEAFQFGRGNLDDAGRLRPAAVRPDDMTPRRTLIEPGGQQVGAMAGGAENGYPGPRDLMNKGYASSAGRIEPKPPIGSDTPLVRRPGAATPEDFDALVARKQAEGMTPSQIFNDPEVQAVNAQVFAPDYNVVPEKPVTTGDITANLRRAREQDVRADAQPSPPQLSRPLYHGTRGDEVQSFADLQPGRATHNQHEIFGAPMPYESTRAAVFLTDNPEFAQQYGDRIIQGDVPAGKAIRLVGQTLDTQWHEFETWLFDQWRANGDNSLREMGVAVKYAPRTPEPWQLFEGKQGEQFVRFLREQGYDYARFTERIPTQADQTKSVRGMTTAVLNPERLRPQPTPESIQQRAQRIAREPRVGSAETQQQAIRSMINNPPEVPNFPLEGGGVAGGAPLPGEQGFSAPRPNALPESGVRATTNTPVPEGRPFVQPDDVKQTWQQNVNDILAAPIGMTTGIDASAPGRQLFRSMLAHPTSVGPVLKAQFKAMRSEAGFQALQDELKNDPLRPLMEQMGIEFGDIAKGIGKREEAIGSTLPERIPYLGAAYKRSNAGYTAAINQQRRFLGRLAINQNSEAIWDGTKMLPEGLEELKRRGRLINAATGRGNLGKAAAESKILGQPIFFAIRNRVGTAQVPLSAVTSKSAWVRKEAARQTGSQIAFLSTLFAAGKASGAWDVEVDPRSSDWGMVRVGNRRFDFTGGLRPMVNVLAREGVSGKNALTGSETPNNKTINTPEHEGHTYASSAVEVGLRYLRSSLQPVLGEVWSQGEGKDIIGNKLPESAAGRAAHAITSTSVPLFLKQVAEEAGFTVPMGYDEGGIGGALAEAGKTLASGALYGQGVGGDYYQPQPSQVAEQGDYATLKGGDQFEAIPAESWRRLSGSQQYSKAIGGAATYGEWRDAKLAEYQKVYEERDHLPTVAAIDAAKKALAQNPVYDAHAAMRNSIETAWVKADPDAALKFWTAEQKKPQSEYPWAPTKEQKAIMLAPRQ